jgi:hypothetical protein
MLERRFEVAAPVLELAVEHRTGDGEDVLAGVVEQVARVGHASYGAHERVARRLGLRDPPGRGVRDALRVVRHRRRGGVELGVAGQRQREDVLPHPEADEHVQAHRDERLQVVGHRRLLDP